MIVCKSIVVLAACFTGLMAGLVQADDCFYYKDKVFPLTISPNRHSARLNEAGSGGILREAPLSGRLSVG